MPFIHIKSLPLSPAFDIAGVLSPETQPEARHPIIVDLLTPDFNDAETVRLMLGKVAESIATRLPFPIDNIFINHRQAHAGDGLRRWGGCGMVERR